MTQTQFLLLITSLLVFCWILQTRSQQQPEQLKEGISNSAIVGIVGGGLAALAVAIVLIVIVVKKIKGRKVTTVVKSTI